MALIFATSSNIIVFLVHNGVQVKIYLTAKGLKNAESANKPSDYSNESTAGADASVEMPKLHNIKLAC